MLTDIEISVQTLAARLKTAEKFFILDVREAWEINRVALHNERVVCLPLSQISRERLEAFPLELRDPQAEIVVMCHHGVRSADVTAWMRENGWKQVFSLAGGIAAYAEVVDAAVGKY